jgi:ferric-dicitrate binding protein FerR (iron transport regulator)
MTDDRLDDLITRHLHGALAPAEVAELSAAVVASEDVRKALADASVLVVGLVGRFPRAEPAAARPPRPSRRWWAVAAALAGVVLVGLGAWALRPGPAPPGYVAEVESHAGEVRVGAAGVGPGTRVESGQTVSTVGMDSGVTLRYPGGARVVLGGDTAVTLTADGPARRVQVERGNLSADVEGDRMTIATPEAAVEAGHAVLAVGRGPRQTEVGVTEGTARVTDPSGSPLMDMAGGDYGTVSADGVARKDRLTRPGDDYRWRPDRPLPAGWNLGRLAPGPDGFVFAPDVWDDPHIFRRCWQIRSDARWLTGLFEIHPDTRVRVRYKVDRPGTGQLLVVVGDRPAPRARCNVLLAPVPFEPAPGGGWRTVELAAADWVLEKVPGRPPLPDLPWTVVLVVFNTYEEDIGLRVAEFAATRPRPGPEPAPR